MKTSRKKMPVLFLGHGSPMNAIETNDFTRMLERLGKTIDKPRSVLCVSAHWMTDGVWATHMTKPRTIHDFHGFPKELFEISYPAPGAVKTAEHARTAIQEPVVVFDEDQWGLDHGAWSVLRHMYPEADVPVAQLSLFITQNGPFHLEIGRKLKSLREQGVLIVGSGNIVHNLRRISWETRAPVFDWAVEFDEWAKRKILARDHDALSKDYFSFEAGRLSVPTPDHYFPLLTALGASEAADEISFPFEGFQNASISMRAVAFGLGS